MSSEKNAGHGSEIGVLVHDIGGPKTNDKGELLDSIHGGVHTKNAHGTLQTEYANVSELLDDALAKNHTHRIEVRETNESPFEQKQQGSEPPTRFITMGNARLEYLDGPRTSEPQQQAPQTTTTTGTPGGRIAFIGADYPRAKDGGRPQSKAHTENLFGGMTAPYAFVVPMDAKDGIGYLRFANATKSAGNPMAVRAFVNDELVRDQSAADAGGAPNVVYQVGSGSREPEAQFIVQRGEAVRVELTPTGDALNDLICDHQSPG